MQDSDIHLFGTHASHFSLTLHVVLPIEVAERSARCKTQRMEERLGSRARLAAIEQVNVQCEGTEEQERRPQPHVNARMPHLHRLTRDLVALVEKEEEIDKTSGKTLQTGQSGSLIRVQAYRHENLPR